MASEPIPEHANFCPPCGSLLSVSRGSGQNIDCRVCGHTTPLANLTPAIGDVATTLAIAPSDLLRRLTGRAATATEAAEAVIDEECPKCGRVGLSYRTAQLRGLDEGQTIFYTCLNKACVHKYKLNS